VQGTTPVIDDFGATSVVPGFDSMKLARPVVRGLAERTEGRLIKVVNGWVLIAGERVVDDGAAGERQPTTPMSAATMTKGAEMIERGAAPRTRGWVAGGHATSQSGAVSPAGMRFSICRRYAPALYHR
jgi:hypothetical protein